MGRWAGLHGCGLTRAKGLQCAAGCSNAPHPPPLQLTQPRLTRPTPPADPEYAGACLHHARQLYTLATQVRTVCPLLAACLPWRCSAEQKLQPYWRASNPQSPMHQPTHSHTPAPGRCSPQQHEGKYSDSIPSVTYVYMSANWMDDVAFAAAWLAKATGGCA